WTSRYALIHGAKKVFDLDDDNIIYADSVQEITKGDFMGYCGASRETTGCPGKHTVTISATSTVPSVFNPYSTGMVPGLDNAETVLWPRGYPLSYIRRDRATTTAKPSSTSDTWTREIAVVQTLADNDPDFDAIYRLT
ncbi:hypothetical protein Pmar_PMAR023022, partial [Perkinsus marinus ATCC 50983]